MCFEHFLPLYNHKMGQNEGKQGSNFKSTVSVKTLSFAKPGEKMIKPPGT